MSELATERDHPLASHTTLGLGGPARHFVEATTRELLYEALAWAEREAVPVRILGGGSNVVVSDDGFDGLVIRVATKGTELSKGDESTSVTVEAGESWDDVVELALDEQLAGLECLSGIPGTAGATPIQNVGAYGVEVSEVIEHVEVYERASGKVSKLTAEECGFCYRDSRFKRQPDRFVVLAVRLLLRRGGAPTVRYPELARALAAHSGQPSLRAVQQAVRTLRASKGMLIEPGWERSVGSFFTNPIVAHEEAQRVVATALSRAVVRAPEEVPQFPQNDGVKLAAGWLVERAGVHKGLRRGSVGVSSRHALALVHHGGGTTRELLALASEIQQRVHAMFGVQLEMEPVRW